MGLIAGIQKAIASLFKPKPMTLITPEELDLITATLSKERCEELSDLINELCTNYGITEKVPFQAFLANCLQESGEMSHREENMNYSAQRLAEVFPGRYSKTSKKPYLPNDRALALHRNPVAIGNDTYGGRMGNTKPNDGWDFRGGGFLGLTGRSTYTDYGKYINMTPEHAADFAQDTDRGALDSACWFFAKYRNLIQVAKTDTFKNVCSIINTGSKNREPIGYDVRVKYHNKIKQVMG